jgi:predicted ATPase/DNA-binding CsgD family transcriptional regulator
MPANLPETVTSFVGRQLELHAARQRMAQARLVTLTGPGGVGKTRLAIEVARAARQAFADGVWMVDLASLDDAGRVAPTVLSGLGVRDQSGRAAEQQLVDHLRERTALILLDNCEHLLDACARLVDGLLRAAPGLRVLATSREPLGIAGEHVLPVPTLTTPDPDAVPPLDALTRYEAVALLIERARSVAPGFDLTADNAADVARLCGRLDGMPLAIELAATRLRSLSVAAVVARLDDRFALLTGGSRAALPRQQTLRALIDWSYDLCTREEQLLWARLSVFAGTFDLAAAEAVCGGEHDVLDLLDHLVAKSIVLTVQRRDDLGYRMLVTIREYGAQRLEEAGATDAIRRRHRDHYRARARAMVEEFCAPGQALAIDRMREDHPNLAAALEWSIRTPAEVLAGAALAADLRYHWVVGGSLDEGRRWLGRILEVAPPGTRERGHALWVAGWVNLIGGDHAAAERQLAECTEIAAALDDPALAAFADQQTALLHFFGGDAQTAVELYERALAGHRRAEHRLAELFTSFQLAMALAYAGEITRARSVYAEALCTSEQRGERWVRAYVLWVTGITEWRAGDFEAARTAARGALELQPEFHDHICAGVAIELLGWIDAAEDRCSRAAELIGAARAVWAAVGTEIASFGSYLKADSLAAEAATRAQLGDQRFDAIVARGRGLSIDQAIAVALDVPAAAATEAGEPSPLTAREQEIAALIADGLSNKAIATSLVVSPRTVDGHLERIFRKLDLTSRAQLAAWVTLRKG